MGTTISNYSQFYKGTQQIDSYGTGQEKKDTLVRYEFNTTDEEGNKLMDKMSKEETYRTMNEISSWYGDNVIVEFSGDGLTAFEEHKGKLSLPEEPKREIPEDMITYLDGPAHLTEEQLKEIQNSRKGRSWESVLEKIKEMSPEAYDEYERLKAADEGGTSESRKDLLKFQARWSLRTEYPDLDVWKKIDANEAAAKNAANNGKVMTDFGYEFASRMPSVYGDKDENGEYLRKYFSVSDAANNMLKVYASLYDEIIKGYEDGTRETYVEDKSSESGYRKLTKDEELAELDKAYKDYSERYAKNRDQGILDILSKHAEKASKLSSGRAKIAGEAQTHLENLRKEMPGDFTDRMIRASARFVSQYNLQPGRAVDIAGILREMLR